MEAYNVKGALQDIGFVMLYCIYVMHSSMLKECNHKKNENKKKSRKFYSQ